MAVVNTREAAAALQNRVEQLEETILELYQAISPVQGTIDFSREAPEDFVAPYSVHAVPIPGTKLSVAFITTPPHLVIGAPSSHTPGPLHWEHVLNIDFPAHTTFVCFGYGGEAGDVQWLGPDGTAHRVPALVDMTASDQIGHFYLARHEGIRSIQITSTGRMFITSLTVCVSAHLRSGGGARRGMGAGHAFQSITRR